MSLADRIGKAVARRRAKLGMTAVDLADRTRELGYPITRVAISKIENNARAGKLDISELSVLAAALRIPPILLVYPDVPNAEVEVLPNVEPAASDKAFRWFTGEVSLVHSYTSDDSLRLLAAVREYSSVRNDWVIAKLRNRPGDPSLDAALNEAQQRVDQLEALISELRGSVFDE